MGNIKTTKLSSEAIQNQTHRPSYNESVLSSLDERVNINVLLYGAGETGKTTFAHSLLSLEEYEFKEEKPRYRCHICWNVLEGFYLVIKVGMPLFNKRFSKSEDRDAAQRILEVHTRYSRRTKSTNLNDCDELIEDMFHLYTKCAVFIETMRRGGRFSLFETWFYFMNKLRNYPEWGGSEWQPNAEDILRVRNRTTGAKIFTLTKKDQKYTIFDIGGQRQERALQLHKNLPYTSVLFFASLAEYNENLFEDRRQNRMRESVRLFGEVVKTMKRKPIVLILNKLDLFIEKYVDKQEPIEVRFPHMPQRAPLLSEEDPKNLTALALEWITVCYSRMIADNESESDVRIVTLSALNRKSVDDCVKLILPFLSSQLDEIALRF